MQTDLDVVKLMHRLPIVEALVRLTFTTTRVRVRLTGIRGCTAAISIAEIALHIAAIHLL